MSIGCQVGLTVQVYTLSVCTADGSRGTLINQLVVCYKLLQFVLHGDQSTV